jgi:hypothetical protein
MHTTRHHRGRGPAAPGAGREAGVAMVMTVTVIMIAAALAALVLVQGSNTERDSGRGANWNEALHVAEAGVDQAIAYLQANNGAVPAPFTGTTTEGSYSVTVTALGRNRYQIDSEGTAGTVAGLQASREIRVVMAPPVAFEYALFSLTDVNTKNNDHVIGDVWANGSVIVDQNDIVEGDVWAATGWVMLDNGSQVTGEVWSGGYNDDGEAVVVSTGAQIGGDVYAASTSPDCVDDPGHSKYKVNVVGSIGGTVTTWGTKTGSGSVGGLVTNTCTVAKATQPMPQFVYNPLNYDPSPDEWASPADFEAYLDAGNRTSLSGVHFVSGGGYGDAIDLTGVEIVGDTTIIALDAPIWANGVGGANGDDKLFVLVSFYAPPSGVACTDQGGNPDDCAVGFKNNFTDGDNTATLIYAPNGPVAFKNNADFDGAVYANDIVLKNNQTVTYDARVDQIIGFGPVTLDRESWVER